MATATGERHRLYEDALAIGLGTLFVAFGMALCAKTVLLVGGTAGLGLLLQYATGWGFWITFSALNLPFYILSLKRLGLAFTLRTFIAVSLVSVFMKLTSGWVEIARVEPVYAALFGGAITGTGLLMLFRHRAGLGGFQILAIWLQDRFNLRAGWFLMGVDVCILALASTILSAEQLALSILGTAMINLILALNHKPGRYLAVSG
ncbi:YitT family protein [Acetobacteraceae bacterium H6797]|nr:YitT family protein [Acetobacteraceae bacterium H6797]